MRAPILTLTLVPSTSTTGLSPRLNAADHTGRALRPALLAAGFLAGDRVTLALESERALALLAVAIMRELRSGDAQKDPRAFVERWMSVVAEADAK